MLKVTLISVCMMLTGLCIAQQKQEWKRYTDPEEAGFDPIKLKAIEEMLKGMKTASYMVVSDGRVVLTSGDISNRYMSHSMRKSFMSAMYGVYNDRGLIDLNKTIGELGIDDIEVLTNEEKSASIKNLITARSGIYHPAAYEPKSMKKNRPVRGSKKPGEAFFYNNWDFNTLHSILEQEAGVSFFDAFIEEIANPIGMQDLRIEDMRYRREPDLSQHSAYLFKVSARDLARFGQLYLNNGKWNGKSIISRQWIKESTAVFSKNLPGFENRGGYGYLWWVDNSTFNEPCYYASGLGGHRLFVFPKSKMVIVHQVNTYYQFKESDHHINELVRLSLEAKTSKSVVNPEVTDLIVHTPEPELDMLDDELLSKYKGTYRHRFFQDITFSKEGEAFRIKGEILGNFRVFPAKGKQGVFFVEDIPSGKVIFKEADSNNPKGKADTRFSDTGIPESFVFYY